MLKEDCVLVSKSVTRSAASLVGSNATKTATKTAASALRRAAATVIGVVGISLLAVQVAPVQTAAASPSFHYQRGYYLDNGWLCYGWSSGAYHCTANWYRASNGQFVSRNPGWVPNGASVSAGGVGTGPHYSTHTSAAPAGISQWAYTGHPAFGMRDYAGDPNRAEFGSCTWWPQYKNRWQDLMQLGNAWQWAYAARSHGFATGYSPRVGATVVFQPGVQGAGGLGHVAHVEAVYSNGWFLVSEMNFAWNGGGWGRVNYRYAHTGSGVSFIYA